MSGEYCNIFFVLWGVQKKQKTAFFGAYSEPPKMILLPKWGPENALFWVIFGHPIKRKICYSTPPTWGHTLEASFPHIFIFSGLSNDHIQQCFDKQTNERTHKLIFQYY